MGIVENVSETRWPKQGDWLGQRCRVVFCYGNLEFLGTIVRDDAEAPHRTIIRLDDGRTVLSTECQFALGEAPPTRSVA